jgi:hypothetical protein
MRGVPIRAVQDLMGHASIVITQRYAHLAPHVSQDAVRLFFGWPQRWPERSAQRAPGARRGDADRCSPAGSCADVDTGRAYARENVAASARRARCGSLGGKESARIVECAASPVKSFSAFRGARPEAQRG